MADTTSGAPEPESRYRAPALDKGLDILELLSDTPGGLTRAEIVKALGRGPSEIYRMLERLVAREYVTRSAEGDRYALTMKLFALGSRHPPTRRLVLQAQPLMDAFAREAMQSVHLAVAERGRAIVVGQSSPSANWEFRLRIGAQLDLATTSSGLTLIAHQTPEERAGMIAPLALEAAATDRLERDCAAIRARGHRIGVSQQLAAVQDVSVPVLGPSETAIAVLTVPYLARLDGKGVVGTEACRETLLPVAHSLSYHPALRAVPD